MPLPSRPVANTTIDSEWGQAVHDYTFAPSGCRSSGGAVTVSTSLVQLPIDTAIEDPGGYVDTAGNEVEVPTGGDGFYLIGLRANTVTGATTSRTRVFINLNGTKIGQYTDDNEGGTNVQLPLTIFKSLTAGDIIIVGAVKLGTGTSPSVNIEELVVVRLGAELGA
jgi:hypothetical protein